MSFETYRTGTKFVNCVICQRPTSEGHSEKLFENVWVCYWCDK